MEVKVVSNGCWNFLYIDGKFCYDDYSVFENGDIIHFINERLIEKNFQLKDLINFEIVYLKDDIDSFRAPKLFDDIKKFLK